MTSQPQSPDFADIARVSPAQKLKKECLLVEVAWEVANQVGGIYTVIRSKVPSMLDKWGDSYCLLGPYMPPAVSAIFEESEAPNDPFGRAVRKMREMGFEVHYGRWLTAGRPRTILFNPFSVYSRLGEIKYYLWEHHGIGSPADDDLNNQVMAFGFLVKTYFACLSDPAVNSRHVIAHVHEWMAATCIPEMRRERQPVSVIFTTHATMLGRYLAMNDPEFYEHLAFYNWEKEAKHFNIESRVRIERAAAHGAHILTTVSEVTARECIYLLGRKPEVILPNGLNVSRFAIPHEIQNVHQKYKERIHDFVTGHFFQSYQFDLDKTMYFFTSGRYEYRNKGYDLTLEALARLNWRMKQANIDRTVVMFFITQKPFTSINPDVLQSKATLTKIRETCEIIVKQVGDKLVARSIAQEGLDFPDLNEFVDDYWKIQLRRTLQKWRTRAYPSVITHNLPDDSTDEILNFLRTSNLINHKSDKVKIVYHPDFISTTSPLLGVEYNDFVKGCHLGVFPSYYEPWGYTPLECMVHNVPAVTSDLAGFGDYILRITDDPESMGLYVVNRRNKGFNEAANQLADQLFSFVQRPRAERIAQRYKLEDAAQHFDWANLTRYYEEAYDQALMVTHPDL
ncbi:MAG: glycogen/starch synthase [Bacteroidia bacterium]|nr:glycogen/starch synthase [Bacteroidia bacterium]